MATRNPGKQREIREILRDAPWEIVFPDDAGLYHLSDEDGLESTDTFEGNARRKAEYFARRSGLPTAAEDSGIEVISLGGQPGVRSRRFAAPAPDQDTANNAELLRRLQGAPAERRRARYRAVLVFVRRVGDVPHSFEGTCAGTILESPKGAGGFGYDPLFLSDELGKSFGEAAPEEKHAVSHRGRALRAFAAYLVGEVAGGRLKL
ncbi:MAG: non-canonical purine NTP pyrophosphatase [Gemmatimonadetes bacterium]|nr:non-canonical purine NTP pyrophosphatase [Gemmatimonadota bacterium]